MDEIVSKILHMFELMTANIGSLYQDSIAPVDTGSVPELSGIRYFDEDFR